MPVPAGLLYYSQLDSILRVEAKQNEIRALITARNELAHYLSKKREVPEVVPKDAQVEVDMEDVSFLPSTIDHSKECRQCYAVDSCMLYRKVSAISEVLGSLTDHFFRLQIPPKPMPTTLSPSSMARRQVIFLRRMWHSSRNGKRCSAWKSRRLGVSDLNCGR